MGILASLLRRASGSQAPESRAAGDYSDRVISALESAAAGGSGAAVRTAAVEIAARWWARVLTLARVSPETPATRALTPSVLGEIAWRLARFGEALFVIDVPPAGAVKLLPVWQHDVRGRSLDPATWLYHVNLAAPNGTFSMTAPAGQILHVRLSTAAEAPWCGVPPWRGARLSADLVSGIETQLSNEAGKSSGYLMPHADGEGGPNITNLQSDMRGAKGATLLTPTHQAGLGAGPGAAPPPNRELKATRFGLDAPQAIVQLRTGVGQDLLALYGVHPSMADPKAAANTLREAWRMLVNLNLEPLARDIAAQVGAALDEPALRLSLADARAADVVMLARAVHSLTGAGVELDVAREVVGL